MSLPSRQQRGGAERQLETQSHHAQSALGLPQVGGETTNAKPNCDLLGPLNNWEKKKQKTVPPPSCGVAQFVSLSSGTTKEPNIIVFCPRLDVVQRLLSAHVVLVSLPEGIGLEVREGKAQLFSQNVSRSFLFNHSCLPSQHAELHGNVASVSGGHELL